MKRNVLTIGLGFSIYLLFVGIIGLNFNSVDSQQVSADPHKANDCGLCHKLVSSLDASGFSITNQDCLDCHDPDNTNSSNMGRLSFHKDKSRNCLDCHSYHDKTQIRAKQTSFEFNFESPALRAQCGSCHDESVDLNKISEAHREATAVYHNDAKYLAYLSPSESCMICHSKNSSYSNKALNVRNTPKFDRHATHPIGQQVAGFNIKSQINSKIKLFNKKIECQTCHNLSSDKKKHISYFEEEYDICMGCHNLNQTRK